MLCCFELLVCDIQIQPLFNTVKTHISNHQNYALIGLLQPNVYDPFTIFQSYHLGTSKLDTVTLSYS